MTLMRGTDVKPMAALDAYALVCRVVLYNEIDVSKSLSKHIIKIIVSRSSLTFPKNFSRSLPVFTRAVVSICKNEVKLWTG
jgi:hypothetical protein